MFPTSANDHGCDVDGNSLGAGLLITAATTASSASSSDKYARLWRRSITVGVFISLKRTTGYPGEDSLPSPTSSSPLITHETDSNSLQQEFSDSNTHNPVNENGLSNFLSKAYNSFSAKSFKDQGTSSPCYDLVPPPPVEHGLSRSSSTRSHHAIDMPSDNGLRDRDTIVRIVKEKNLNSLKEFGGVEKAALTFRSHLKNGLDDNQQPQIWNTNNSIPTKGFFYFLLKACNSYTIFLLLLSSVFSFITGMMKQGPKYGWHDGVAILAAVFMLLTFPSVANFRRARKLEKKIQEEKNKLEVNVVRSGKWQLITISNLAEGDIVHLRKGDRVPADGLVVNSNGLVLDDVLNSNKDPEQNPFLFSGSMVMDGHGSMLVTSVGANTALGEVLSSVIEDANQKTLLEAQTEKPNAYTENLSLFVSLLIAFVAVVRLLSRKHSGDENGLPEMKGNVSVGMMMKILGRILLKPQGKISILVSALTVVVIAIQHGMPFVITISLCFWNEKVLISKAKLQNLSACATMGIVTVICIDATGRLVSNETKVNKFLIGEKDINNDADCEIDQVVLQGLRRGIDASVLAPEISVSPINDSLKSWANSKWSSNVEFVDPNLSILKHRKLNSKNKVCGILVKNNDDEEKVIHMHWSGAASTILDMCSHYYDSKGVSHEIKDEKRKFQELIKDMGDSGLKPVAFACSQTEVLEIKEDGLHLLALAGLRYPCSEEIKSTVEALESAGVRIILVSEDELSAVRAIACELGTCRPGSNDVALEGEQFRDLNLTERMVKVERMTLTGSCLSKDKLLLIQSLQQKGHVVAFFGGSSTSDTPSLKEADVGITEENWCTEMAGGSSDIVIAAKGSLPPIVKLGRCAYCNIQKFSQLQLTTCISGLLITLVTTLSLEDSPITPVQLMWINWIMYILGAIMMTMEFKDQEPIINPPAKRTKSLLNRVVWKHVAIQVLCQAFVLLIFQFKGQVIPSINKDVQKAMIFCSFSLCQIFEQFNAMRLPKKEMLSVVLRNYTFLVALMIVIVMQVLVAEYAKSLAGYPRLNGMQWSVCFVLAALPWGIHCTANLITGFPWNRSFCFDGRRREFSRRQHWPYISFLGIPFSMFLFFSISYYYNPDNSFTFARMWRIRSVPIVL